MHRRNLVLPLVAVILAACSTDVVAPLKVPTGPKLAVGVNKSGSYIVLTNGGAFPADFAAKVASLGGRVIYANDNVGFAAVSGLSAAAASQVGAIGGISSVQSDVALSINTPLAVAEADMTSVGNDEANSVANPATAARYSWQWNMRLIGADKAWAASKLGNAGVTVAILDTGLDYDINDLNGLVDLSRSASFMDQYIFSGSASDTVPHLSDNALAAKFFPTRNPVTDFNGHGTNVATQVSSKAFALAGVTSKTTLIGVKVLGQNGSGSLSSVLSGVLWAADHGADVANMSLGGGFSKAGNGFFVGLINKVFNYANSAGMLIVVSAGNSGLDLQHNGNIESTYCDSPHVICVSSVGPNTIADTGDRPAFYTNYGRQALDVAAPGGNAQVDSKGNPNLVTAWPWGNDFASWVWSYCPKNRIAGYAVDPVTKEVPKDPTKQTPILTACAAGNRLSGFIGTSQASPHVAGLAASLVAEMGHGQPSVIKHAILSSAADINPLLGRGRISVSNAFGL